MSRTPLVYWIEEREQNALRIADTKHGTDREGWLEDASYFSQCKASVVALKILRAWNSGTAGFDGQVVVTLNKWIDAGMSGPIPFPDNPFFREWAEATDLSNVDGFVGIRR